MEKIQFFKTEIMELKPKIKSLASRLETSRKQLETVQLISNIQKQAVQIEFLENVRQQLKKMGHIWATVYKIWF